MPKPSIAELLVASGYRDFSSAPISRAINSLYGNVGANSDERDWAKIMASGDPLLASENALAAMYRDPSYLLRNAEQLQRGGYGLSQAEYTYRQIYGRLGIAYDGSWSKGTVMEVFGKMSLAELTARATADAFARLPIPQLSVSADAEAISINLSMASSVQFSTAGSLGRLASGSTVLGEKNTILEGFLTATSDDGKSSNNSLQYVVLGTAGADTIDTSASGTRVDYVLGGAGSDVISTGGGDDVIISGAGSDQVNAGSGNDRLYLGAGADTGNPGSGADEVFLGANDAAVDTIIYSASGETATGLFTNGGSTAGMDIISEMQLGDLLDLWDVFSANPSVTTAYLTNAAVNNVALVRGSYAAGAFTAGVTAADDDYMLQWSDGTAIHSVIVKDFGASAPSLSINVPNDTITFSSDTTAPQMLSAAYAGNQVVITYSEAITGPAEAGDYFVRAMFFSYPVSNAVIGSGANSNKVTLTLFSSVPSDRVVDYIAYNSGAGTPLSIKDASGNSASSQTLTSNISFSDTTPPTIVSAEYEGSTVKLYYSETIAGSAEAADYTVTLSNASTAPISSATMSGKVVTLTLGTSLAPNAISTIAYSANAGTANSIKDVANPANNAATQTLSDPIISLFSGLSSRTISGTNGLDKFVFAVGDTGVAINSFTSGADKINLDALETYGVNGFNFNFSGPGGSPYGWANNTVVMARGGGTGAADTSSGAASYVSTLAAWSISAGLQGYIVVVDDDSTGIFRFVSDGALEIETAELTLIATVSSVTVTNDYVFA